jgi:hypothetical protein
MSMRRVSLKRGQGVRLMLYLSREGRQRAQALGDHH